MSEILTDGFPTQITFTSSALASAADVHLLMEEQDLTPPGVSGGGPNDTTSMRNEVWRTRHPKKLKTLTSAPLTVKYDPEFYDLVNDMINDNQQITVTFPDGSRIVFWGWIDSFTPNACAEGDQPTATMVIEPSNMDADHDNVEIAPRYYGAAA